MHSHMQPYTTLYKHTQLYVAINNHIQPYTSTCSHIQPYTAIYNHMLPYKATCSYILSLSYCSAWMLMRVPWLSLAAPLLFPCLFVPWLPPACSVLVCPFLVSILSLAWLSRACPLLVCPLLAPCLFHSLILVGSSCPTSSPENISPVYIYMCTELLEIMV